jgi:hypothetical protein
METNLLFKRVGNYSMDQCSPDVHCDICGTPKMGTILVETKNDWEECLGKNVLVKNYICVDCLLHYYDTTKGLMATDKLDDILQLTCDPENQPHQFVNCKEKLGERFFLL